VIRWGYQNKKQRFKCKKCGLLFTRSNKSVKRKNQFVWFENWINHRQTISFISSQSGYSQRHLKNVFSEYLASPPKLKIYPSEKLNLIIDGTYFSNDICLIVYRDNTIKFTQLYRITDGEHYSEIKEDLANLLLLGVQVESITCDGHRSLLKAIRDLCSEVIVQRCLVHIQRECKIWLTAHPRTIPGMELLKLVHQIHRINTNEKHQQWLIEVWCWYETYKSFINEKVYSNRTNRYWFKHKAVRRSFVMIKNALPNMFQYLFNERIPKSTNALESFFGHLKSHLLLHRGLTKEHRKNFIKWYLYFKNQA
jgi:Transposase, Mutator family